MRTNLRGTLVAVLVTATAVVLAGCGSGMTASSTTVGGSDPAINGAGALSVVASTNVWGDVVRQVGGDRVDVLSVISDPSVDPHYYEANAQTLLALSKAAMIIENGGGYDDFIDTMLSSAGTSVPVINAVDVSGKAAAGGELNEHVWYDLPTVGKVAQQVATTLSRLDPRGAAQFAANATTFTGKLDAMTKDVESVKAAHGGTAVALTEPVPGYLLQAAGLVDLTPAGFSAAIERDTDVPPAVLQDTLALFTDKQVAALFYNEQTGGPQTDAVVNAAKSNSIAVIPVRETLPEGRDYVRWMEANIAAMAKAVGP